ncbi:MAG: EamA family transporter [Candidatus Njordarchaeia archaeon]
MKETDKARLFLLTTTILWGTSFPVIRFGLMYIPPLYFVFLRFLISFVVTFLLLIPLHKLDAFISVLKNKFVALTGLLNGLAFILQFVGQKYTFATNASLLLTYSPR